jgi:hypothetical protein
MVVLFLLSLFGGVTLLSKKFHCPKDKESSTPASNAGACEAIHLARGEPTRATARLAWPSSDASIHFWAREGR